MTANAEKSCTPGTLFVISAPSGAGKTSLITALVEEMSNLVISLSYTTRAKRSGELNGVHYNFIDDAKFDDLLSQNEFIEYAEVFGHRYGTSHKWVTQRLEQGFDILLEIDWQGARQISKIFAENSTSIFVLPPSIATLEQRLLARKQDSSDVIKGRMAKAIAEMTHYPEYDYLVINEDFEIARRDLKAIITAERLKSKRQSVKQQQMLSQLLAK
jgi:guanylate kinase